MYLGGKKLKDASGGTQLFILLALYYFGIILGAAIAHLFMREGGITNVYNIRISHIIQGSFLFLIPALVYSNLFADMEGRFLTLKPLSLKILLLSILVIFAIQPLAETVNYYNNLIELPQSMAALNEFFQKSKESSEAILKLIFADKSLANLMVNILIIAVLPGIMEELFFRGCMQRSILKIAKNPHTAIWITAVIFSLLHFQLTGFFPRILLGALLGYLYLWSKNIWIPIIVHIIHNATIVVLAQMFSDTEFYKKYIIAEYSLSNAGIATFISLVLTAGILFVIHKQRAKA